ncbi:hypothetical protein A2U01_0080670, partial [Trifolium medium]|nr:hypothetical protein [Trifolium medium]
PAQLLEYLQGHLMYLAEAHGLDIFLCCGYHLMNLRLKFLW